MQVAIGHLPHDSFRGNDFGHSEIHKGLAEANGEGIAGLRRSAREHFGPPIRDAADSVDRFVGPDLGRDSSSVISLSHLTLLFADCCGIVTIPTWSRRGS